VQQCNREDGAGCREVDVMYRVEFRNDRGDWIRKGFYRIREEADKMAEHISSIGYTARIVSEGRILLYVEREAK